MRNTLWSGIVVAGLIAAIPAHASAVAATVAYQPMVSTGLAANQPFEAWIVLDKPLEPTAPGYAVPAGARMRFKFPTEFTPGTGMPPGAVLLHGWPQKAINVKFSVSQDPTDPRAIVIDLHDVIDAAGPERPGLKAIHLRTSEMNPAAGEYPIEVQFVNAGQLSGTAKAVAHITPAPVPNVAAYNQLHEGRNQNWQHVSKGAEAPLPIDFLVTLPDVSRSTISLRPVAERELAILQDGKRIGGITTAGVPVTLEPQMFGPGFARLGIIRVRAKGGSTSGVAEIKAALQGGTEYVIHIVVD